MNERTYDPVTRMGGDAECQLTLSGTHLNLMLYNVNTIDLSNHLYNQVCMGYTGGSFKEW